MSTPRERAIEADPVDTSQSGVPQGRRSRKHPLSAQCPAKSKATGNRCQRWVIGGGPCPMHGGRAPQVAAAREARILAGEASMAIDDAERRSPAEALLAASGDADVILQRLKRQVREGEAIDGSLLQALGDWIDRTARISKTVMDARIDEKRVELQQGQAQIVIAAVRAALDTLTLVPADRDRFLRTFLGALGRGPEVVRGELGE